MGNSAFKKQEDYYQNRGDDLLKLVPSNVKSVLDIGCGFGFIGKRLKDAGAEKVIGIEASPEAAEKAREHLDKVYIGNIETMELEFNREAFDCIVLGDVIEHLVNPWNVIKDLIEFLDPDGSIVISLPNIGHWSVIKELLRGNWTYVDKGILDITHLRFFTLKSARKMFEDNGFAIDKITYRLDCAKFFKKVNKLMGGKLTHFLAWQYLIRVRKKGNRREGEAQSAGC